MASFWALRSARLIFSAALDAAGNRAQSERRRRDRTISGRNRSIRSPSKKPETGALGEPEGFNNCARASPPSRYNNSLREVSSHAPGLLRQQRHHAPPSQGTRGHAPLDGRAARQPVVAPWFRAGGAQRRRGGAGAGGGTPGRPAAGGGLHRLRDRGQQRRPLSSGPPGRRSRAPGDLGL